MDGLSLFLSLPSRRLILAGAVILFTCGCLTTPERLADSDATMSRTPQPVDRAGDNYEWIKRLRATEPVEVKQQIAAPGSQVVFPVPVPYTAAGQYQLVINQVMRLAWLQTNEGTLGPWSMEHPDVRHLVESVAIPPTNPQPAQ
ncbi:MAG: hypothetical protein NXI04_09740 [Planctomycetaceae bacterium]|nr:hypothetical protein [Planctomycetaceae bacterium]